MQLLSEFRYPTRWYSKLIAALLALSFFSLLAAGIISGYAVYSVVNPTGGAETIDLANFPGHAEDVSYTVGGTAPRDGWFFPGLKSAPTILLCPGYRVDREELLPLATALQDHQYNVFLFDFAGTGSNTGRSTLGFGEVQELRAAISVVAERNDVDRSRFGLWGTNVGAYAAVAVAESDPRVRALSVESAYDRPQDMLGLLTARSGLATLPLMASFTQRGFLWLNYQSRDTPPLAARISRLTGVPKLFLEAGDDPELAKQTHRLFSLAPDPKEDASIPHGNYAGMPDEEKRSYENRILSFFLLSLPP